MKNDNPELSTTGPSNQRRRFLRASCAMAVCAPSAVSMLGSSIANAKSTVVGESGRVPLISQNPASPLQGQVAKLETMTSRRLHLVNEHTGDDLDVVYFTHGIFLNDSVSMLNHLMRDRRANLATQMDTTLYDMLYSLRSVLDTEKPIHILSGYRTPETNAKLRRRSKRVAKYSLHMEGRAADIYVPGFSVKQVQQAALSLQGGGVGLYSKSNFVHVDTGQVRHWER